jgi:hypothetical protein
MVRGSRKRRWWRAAQLSRPDLEWGGQLVRRRAEHAGHRDKGTRDNSSPEESQRRNESRRSERWRTVDVVAMIIAALQIVLPISLVILAAAGLAYWLFMTVFGG